MAIQQVIDITADINADGRSILDVGGFDYAVVELVTPNTTASFASTSDSGDITGISDGSAASATNFVTTQGTDLSSGSAVSSLATTGQVKFTGGARYLRIMGGGLTVTKGIVRLFKVN